MQDVAKIVEKKIAIIEKDLKCFKKQTMDTETYPEIVNNICMPNWSAIKFSTCNGKSTWQVYRTQFAVVADANEWDFQTKACQLLHALLTYYRLYLKESCCTLKLSSVP